MDRADLRVSVAHVNEEIVVTINGELDMSTADQLSDTVNEELREAPGRIVIDLAGLTFCDSLGLGTLVVLSRTARVQQTYLLLRNPSPFFTRMLDVTGVREGLNVASEHAVIPETAVAPENLDAPENAVAPDNGVAPDRGVAQQRGARRKRGRRE